MEHSSKIVDIKGVEHEFSGCISCEILSGKLSPFGGILFETQNFFVCTDFEVPIAGFMIISTKRHLSSINEFSDDEKIEFIMLLDKCLKALKATGVASEFILLQGERKDIHFHTSLFPRQAWMKEKFGRVVSHMKDIQEYAIANMKTPENLAEIEKICKKFKEMMKNQ